MPNSLDLFPDVQDDGFRYEGVLKLFEYEFKNLYDNSKRWETEASIKWLVSKCKKMNAYKKIYPQNILLQTTLEKFVDNLSERENSLHPLNLENVIVNSSQEVVEYGNKCFRNALTIMSNPRLSSHLSANDLYRWLMAYSERGVNQTAGTKFCELAQNEIINKIINNQLDIDSQLFDDIQKIYEKKHSHHALLECRRNKREVLNVLKDLESPEILKKIPLLDLIRKADIYVNEAINEKEKIELVGTISDEIFNRIKIGIIDVDKKGYKEQRLTINLWIDFLNKHYLKDPMLRHALEEQVINKNNFFKENYYRLRDAQKNLIFPKTDFVFELEALAKNDKKHQEPFLTRQRIREHVFDRVNINIRSKEAWRLTQKYFFKEDRTGLDEEIAEYGKCNSNFIYKYGLYAPKATPHAASDVVQVKPAGPG